MKAENFFRLVFVTIHEIFRETESEMVLTDIGGKKVNGMSIGEKSWGFNTNGIYEIPPIRIMSAITSLMENMKKILLPLSLSLLIVLALVFVAMPKKAAELPVVDPVSTPTAQEETKNLDQLAEEAVKSESGSLESS